MCVCFCRYLLGRAYEALSHHEKAADCYITSLESKQFGALRDFSETLWVHEAY